MTSDGRRRLATTEATRTCRRHVTADLLAAIKTMSEITTVQRVRKSQRKKTRRALTCVLFLSIPNKLLGLNPKLIVLFPCPVYHMC